MSSTNFYTDRTQGPRSRVREDIPAEVWRGLVGLVRRRIADGSLAREFPARDCDDSPDAITSTDERAFETALGTLVPDLRKARETTPDSAGPLLNPGKVPPTPVALDVIDFTTLHVAEPVKRDPHPWASHEHLVFNKHAHNWGQEKFRGDVELIFARNGIAFTIGDDKQVQRLGPPEARLLLSDFAPNTTDATLDRLLRDAHGRFLSRNRQDRVDAIEKLWDAFERLKSLENPADKKASVQQLLAKAAGGNAEFRAHLDAECSELTKIGNGFHIRHFEASKHPLPTPTETSVDYLFIRMLSLVAYLLRQTGRTNTDRH
jgi:hypothetical protein